ncbi:hypothetical protein N7540_013159 [Penicillium herquei]|nr:hypothetical protein N7540_013159 [Penicillium herquei]
MFSNRNNDRKPDTGLIKKFQANFSDIMKTTSESNVPDRLIPPLPWPYRPVNPKDLQRDTAQATPELRFTPFLDDQSLPYSSANQSYNKSLNTFNTGLHGLAGDLHTPTLQSRLLTPETLLDQYTSAVTPLHKNKFLKAADPFDPQYLAPTAQDISCGSPLSAYQPSTLVQPDGVDGIYNGSSGEISVGNLALDAQTMSRVVDGESFPEVGKSTVGDNTNFRYQISLNTPTAMIQNPNDIPITYLNKGQTYSLSIVDSKFLLAQTGLTYYRTSIRITFDTIEHASNPNSCWSLWKASSTYDASHKSRNLNAVELVDLGQHEGQAHNFHVERASLDGFAIKWFTNASGVSACTLGIRFNFLSTDFSYSKGVKGSPLRLFAKTETITPGIPELSYCKVKVFRDHGAERKMFTDVSQLKRAIERRKVDYLKALSGGENLGKRKRGSQSIVDTNNMDTRDERMAHLQNNLDAELAEMHRAFSSNRSVSKFCLPGDVKDDPDLFPIQLLDEGTQVPPSMPQPALNNLTPPSTLDSGSRDLTRSPANHRTPKSTGEITTRSNSLVEDKSPTGSNIPSEHAFTERKVPTDRLVPTKSEDADGKSESGDKSTCFYIRFQNGEERPDDFHTALFLTERTAQNLKTKVSQKRNFSLDLGVELFQVRENGLKIRIDDDVVERIPNNQAMSAEISRRLVSDDSTEGERVSGTIEVKLHC